MRHRTSALRCSNVWRNAPRSLIHQHLSTRRYCRPTPTGLQDAVRIGTVELDLSHHPADHPELIPRLYLPDSPDQRSPTLLRHLQWMLQKDALGQDMLLVGPPGAGSVYRRRLALMYAEMTRREVEVLTLSSDTTESDLKQRKELVHSAASNGRTSSSSASVEFVDQAPVRAALNGRLLILDGLHKAERNVLPTLNNLLENREMNLDCGKLLVSQSRYQDLFASGKFEADDSFLVPVNDKFRVLALATPAPPYPGRGLDPPLRSRFQIRRVDPPMAGELITDMTLEERNEKMVEKLAAFASAMNAAATTFSSSNNSSSGRTLVFPSNAIPSVASTMGKFPEEDVRSVLSRQYPIARKADERLVSVFGTLSAEASQKAFESACDELELGASDDRNRVGAYKVTAVDRLPDDLNHCRVKFSSQSSREVEMIMPCGTNEFIWSSPEFVHTKCTREVLKNMLQEHGSRRDILLVSEKGEGKSRLAAEFTSMLGYGANLFNLYKEMSGRDLLQRRATDQSGDTKWEDSPIIRAAVEGNVCILDGVERLGGDTLATLGSLLVDRETHLPDGSRLIQSDGNTFQASSTVRSIHPSFRLIALGTLASRDARTWLTEDVMAMLSTIVVPTPEPECMRAILSSANPKCPDSVIDDLLNIRSALKGSVAIDCGVQPLSTRNLLRIVRLMNADDDNNNLRSAIRKVLLAELLPPTQRASLESVLDNCGIISLDAGGSTKSRGRSDAIYVDDDVVAIGDVRFERRKAKRSELVPKPHYVDIPSQVATMKKLMVSMNNGERSFLLLGSQGCGKNKLTDRLCEIANMEREYIQLHRDSTVGSLTLTPALEEGRIVFKDSPLVRAVQRGVALVIDEADKAPTEVTSVLKSLVEDGELLLANGKRISRTFSDENTIPIHPAFTMFILANRPGFPFHGNDLFREVGDCFDVLVVPNPDLESEMDLLQSFGPDVSSSTIRQIASSFDHLRSLADHGDISYPYSTREAVAVVRHLQQYPDDGIVAAIHNILDFDSFDDATYLLIGKVFSHYGIEMSSYGVWQEVQARIQATTKCDGGRPLAIEYMKQRNAEGTSSSPPPLSMPKVGKWDEKNEAHVGGNQWQGGTGGSDTAGLGGRGGPFRLDRGHKIHQVSDAAKAEVTEEGRRAGRAMAEKALKEKLNDINMDKHEWSMFMELLSPIEKDIAILRNTLRSVEGKQSEKTWIRSQSQGELDDTKLVDGVAGERYIFKKRGVEQDATSPLHQKPKRLRFVIDASASMYRFNSYDGRLNKALEAALLVMKGFEGMEDRFQSTLVGHSGDSPAISFGDPPTNEKHMMRILQAIVAHTQYCSSGDFTLEAVEQAIDDVGDDKSGSGDQEHDENIVIAISDANLRRYGIHPRELGKIIEAGEEKSVKAHVIFIASFGQEAEEIKRQLPPGRAHIANDTSDLPRIVRSILTSSVE